MVLVNLEDLTVGMVVSDQVTDRAGRLVMAAGSEITEKHLRIFKMWGIEQVDVDVDAEDMEKYGSFAVDQSMIEGVEAETREQFRHTDLENPIVQALFEQMVQRKVRQRTAEDQA